MLYKKRSCQHNYLLDHFLMTLNHYGHSGKVDYFYPYQDQKIRFRCLHLKCRHEENHSAFFLHGAGNDLLYPNKRLFLFLLNQGINIFSFDLAGHGALSTGTFSKEHLTDFIHHAWQQFISLEPHSKKSLIGVSLGGVLAAHLASQLQDERIPLILVALPFVALTPMAGVKEMLLTPWHLLSSSRSEYGDWYDVLPALFSFKRRQYPLRLEKKYQLYMEEVFKVIFNLKPADTIKKLSNKILYIGSDQDFIAPFQEAFNENKNVKSLKIAHTSHLGLLFCSGLEEWISYWCKQ